LTDSTIELQIEKPTAGGRMLARHQGQVVLVWGAIPGERVRARIERPGKGVLFAETVDVLEPSADRRAAIDWRCGGNVFAHIAYDRQPALKAAILQDAFSRIARMPLPAEPAVMPSPEAGYRMRARLHVSDGRFGFLREGTHDLCDPSLSHQLLPSTMAWMADAERELRDRRLIGVTSVEIAENVPAGQRACHLELRAGVDAAPYAALAATGLTGVSAQRADSAAVTVLAGTASIADEIRPRPGDATALRLQRDVRAFFQANRYLLEPLVHHVVSAAGDRPIVDLYAGVGLFGLSLATAGAEHVTLVEGDHVSAADLAANAEPFAARVTVERSSVERYLDGAGRGGREIGSSTFVIDPPRTGLSKEAIAGVVKVRPRRLVYVSCDVATLARDTRVLIDAGYQLVSIRGFDLFPNTAHVETVAVFESDGMK
jgi:tRNA/tmRNA/rRNA uracil-C5-methylase (TrmA/RlmC/RlmD family)